MILRSTPILFICCVTRLCGAEQGQLDASEPLFTVMAAANAAGYDAGLNTSPALRQQVRERVSGSGAPVIVELKAWYKEHPERDKTQDLSRFISLGLSIAGPPNFEWTKRDVEVPPDAMAMNELRKLVPRFYAEAKIAALWQQSQPSVDATLERYQGPIAKAVQEANSYLRNVTSGFLGRHFQIFIDLLSAPNQVQTRSYGDDYFLVLTPSNEPRVFEVRHAYIRYLIDPLAIKYGMELKEKASLMDIAEGAPLLRDPYRADFGLLATECLIKAIESRLNSNPSMIDQALGEGYVLAPFFNEQLAIYEKQPESMKLFFPKMVQILNVKHEVRRLEHVQFGQELSQRATTQTTEPAASLAAQTAAQADHEYYEKQDLDSARKLYEQALLQAGSANDHSKAYYGLAHIALRQKNPEAADQLFRKTLESSPDGEIQAWSCYYLGKLSAVANDNDEAVKWFHQVLAVKGASPKAVESTRRELAQISPAGK